MKKHKILSILARGFSGVLLLYALQPNPYGYYQVLRVVVCLVAVYCIWLSYKSDKHGWLVFFAVTAILFNPLIPFHLTREIWAPIDLGVGIGLFVSIFFVPRLKKNKTIS